MDKKKAMAYVVLALAVYGGIKFAKRVKSKGGIMPALGLKS